MNFPVLYEGSGDPTFPVFCLAEIAGPAAKRVSNGMGNVIAKALSDCPVSLPSLADSRHLLHREIHLDVYAALHYMILRAGELSAPRINDQPPDAHAAGCTR